MGRDQHVGRGWVIADVWETIAQTRPTADCIVQGSTRLTWADFDRQADAVAAALLRAGLGHQAKVAFFVRNSPAFLVGVFACLKVGLVPVNTNFRYNADEAARLWADADAECVVFSADLIDVVQAARPRASGVRAWWRVADGSGAVPEWAASFDPRPVSADAARAPWSRSPDDLLLLYTGGTTGRPKGVMWRQDDVFGILNDSARVRYERPGDVDEVAETQRRDPRERPRFVPCGPLIHGTGGFSSYAVLGSGGTVILLNGRTFDPVELLDTIDREHVNHVSVVGEAHTRPIADQLDAHPGRWSLASLRLITSSGMLLSEGTRARLLRHTPHTLCVDLLGSSEVPSVGKALSTASSLAPAATFVVGPAVRVLDDDGRDVLAGSGTVGVLAVRGRHPLGYYKDPERSAALFRTVDGESWSVTSDLATVQADGTIQLLGRGVGVINTGGEKVYPREIEDALLRHADVVDAAVIALPHDVLGQMVVAAVQARPGSVLDPDEVAIRLRSELSGYKVPKQIHVLDSLGRNDSGKLNYAALLQRLAQFSSETTPR
jgi:acyl-CoA synthetase (AMP-forming)/AMP-acid ligase II